MADFNDAINLVFDELLPKAESLAAGTDRTVKACMSSILQGHIKDYLFPPGENMRSDNRTRKWNIRLVFLSSPDGVEFEEVAESEPELVQGYAGVVDAMRSYYDDVHEAQGASVSDEAEFGEEELKKRFNSLRPAISRGGGKATMFTQYSVNEFRHTCILYVSREEIPLTT